MRTSNYRGEVELQHQADQAASLQLDFALFPSRWMHRGLAPTMKAAMNLIGIGVGEPYPPYVSLTAEELETMTTILRTTSLGRHFGAAENAADRLVTGGT